MWNDIQFKYLSTVLVLLILSSCVPFSVKKVEYSDKVDGARYCIKRPALVAALQVNMGTSSVIDLKSCNKNYQCKHALKDEYIKLSKPAIQEAKQDGITQCLYHHEDSSNNSDNLKSNLGIKINIQQTLKTIDVYEVKHQYGFGLTNSALSVSTDEEGCLSNVSSTEADQTLEVINSVAALSISRVTNKIARNQEAKFNRKQMMRTFKTPNLILTNEQEEKERTGEFIIRPYGGDKLQCVYLDYKQENNKFQVYLNKHIGILRKHESVKNTLNNNYKKLENISSSVEQKQTLESIALLKTEKTALAEQAKVVGYRIPQNKYQFFLNGKLKDDLEASKGPKWFTVSLCERGKEQQCSSGEQ